MSTEKPLYGDAEMCNAFILIYPRMKATSCVIRSINAQTWGQRHLGWKQTPIDEQGNSELLQPVTVGNVTYINADSSRPLIDAEFWAGKEERVRVFEADGAVEPFWYQCGQLKGLTNKHMVKKLPKS